MTRNEFKAAAAIALLALAGCAGRYLPVDEAGRRTVVPTGAALPMPANTPDTCGASKLQYLVGKPQSQIPVPADLSHQRVACTTCMLSQLFDPKRVTILYDQPSGLVTKVICQ